MMCDPDAAAAGHTFIALSEYGITPARRPVDLNRALRRAGLLNVHTQAGMEYLDPWTSRAFDMATQDLAKMAQSGKPLFGINSTNHERVVIFAGGLPVKSGSTVIGAVGASGGTVDQDQQVAEAAVAAFDKRA